jgi:hypothetical protein
VPESPDKAAAPAIELRDAVAELAALLVCAWTGYFLVRGWADADWTAVVLVCVGTIVAAGGALRLAHDAEAGGRSARSRVGVLAALAGMAAVGMAGVIGWGLPTGGQVLSIWLGHRLTRGNAMYQFTFGGMAALCAVVAGANAAGEWPAWAGKGALVIACYVGLAHVAQAHALRRQAFLAVVCLLIALALLIGATSFLFPEYWMLSVLFAAWVALRLGLIARKVLGTYEPRYVRRFGQEALLGTGLVAGALLVLKVASSDVAGDPKAVSELAWPVIAGAFSLAAMRVWPFLWRSREPGSREGETEDRPPDCA